MVVPEARAEKPAVSPLVCMRESLRFVDGAAVKLPTIILLLLVTAVMPVLYASLMRGSLDSFFVLDRTGFVRNCALLVAAYLLGATLTGISVSMRSALAENVAAGQRSRIVKSVLAMPLSVFEKSSRGDLISRLTADIDQSARIVTTAYLTLDVLLRAAAATAYMIYMNWIVGLASICSSLIVMWVTKISNAPIPAKSRAYQKSIGDLSSTALNSLEGVTVVKSFCAEDAVSRSFSRRAQGVLAAGVSLAKSTARMRASTTLAAFLTILSAFAVGGYMAVIGELTAGSVLALLHLTDSIGILIFLGPRWSEVQKSAGAYERVRSVMEKEADSAPDKPATVAAQSSLAIEISHLSFEYEPGHPVLKDVSFEVPLGKKVAIIGKSGCGKSTLIKVIGGLYPPPPGAVRVNGMDMHYERLGRGREQISYVLQEPFLLSGSIRDNLLLASESASGHAISEALRTSDSLEFTGDLSGGLDSLVGEKGSLLSGGQRQRLCMARGLLRDAPILLLDEPTSSLDRESEARVIEALYRMPKLTCLTVTHRPQVAEASDMILVMDGGRVVESGTHSELLESRSLYRSFWSGETRLSPVAAAASEGEGSR